MSQEIKIDYKKPLLSSFSGAHQLTEYLKEATVYRNCMLADNHVLFYFNFVYFEIVDGIKSLSISLHLKGKS